MSQGAPKDSHGASKDVPRRSPRIHQDPEDAPRHLQRDQRTTLESFGKFYQSLKNHLFPLYFHLQRHRWMILVRCQRSGAPQGTPKTFQGTHNDDQGPPQGAPEDAQ